MKSPDKQEQQKNLSLNSLKSNGSKYFKNIRVNSRMMITRAKDASVPGVGWRQRVGKKLSCQRRTVSHMKRSQTLG